ncbi:ATP-dependent helicase [Candidatus Nomurabacteria bacterium]|nr:ATP-dependent helicase [Candidatus Nomurabacteria bacterium]
MSLDLKQLNKAQKQAVLHDQGPAMLIAGAGTGKTTVITQRIACLIEKAKAKPEDILAVTFTEKAAGEMEERVDQLLPLGYSELWIHTFHGFAEKILKDYALDIGLANDFKLLDSTAAWMLVRNNLEKFDLDYYRPLGNPTKFIHALLSHFSRCKDEVIYPEDYLAYVENLQLDQDSAADREDVESEIKRQKEIANAYHTYQQLLLDHSALDFGDLINYTLKLFQTRPKILKKFREQFKYILVDEFQDTNWAQYELIKLLAAPNNNLMVVGDDDQAIYKFRGAAISNILSFQKDYPAAAQIFLTDNYRSGQKILDTAYNFIKANDPDRLEAQLKVGKKKLDKKLTSHSENEGEVKVLSFADKNSEVDGILNKIFSLKKKNKDLNWSDFAILVRANDQAAPFVSMLRKVGWPHQFLASRGLYAQDIVLDILAYLKMLDNYHESAALFRILSLPCVNLDIKTLINLNHLAYKKSWSLYYTLQSYPGHLNLNLAEQRTINELLELIKKHTEIVKTKSVSQIIYIWLEESGYLKLLTLEDSVYSREQLHFLNQFFKKVRSWEEESLEPTIKQFLQSMEMELESGEQGALKQDQEAGPDAIKIMTVHGSKGLEFKYVFITNLVHLRFPSTERRDPIEIPENFIKEILPSGDAHLQEERRLFYVALTRAKEAVYLTYAKDYGGTRERKPSRFIEEIKIAAQDIAAKEIKEPPTVDQNIEKVKNVIPKSFSFSQLKAYETCPRQYYYSHVVKLQSKGKASFSFGKTMHSTLQKFFSDIILSREKQQADLFGEKAKTLEPSLKDLLQFYQDSWIDDWFDGAEEKEKYHQEGEKILKEFYQKFEGHWPVPLFLEKGFNLKFGEHSFKGVFDRVDVDSQGDWEIVDYKTGKPKSEKITFEDKKQLLIYQIAATEVFNVPVKALTFYYLNNNTPISFLGTEKEIDKTKTWILETIASILSGDFTATPGFACQTCDFKQICPFAKKN